MSVAYLKRTHHLLDLPEKASGRVWSRGPSAMVLRATDRVQITLPPGDGTAESLIALVPATTDVVLLETHNPEPFSTLLNEGMLPGTGENVIGTWSLDTIDRDGKVLARQIADMVPRDRTLDHALRSAMALHGGHACPGIILGTRLALCGAAALGVEVPDREKRLIVHVETDRCAVDAIQAVTGCRPGKRTLRILDYGKLAATFWDQRAGRGVRVAARGDLREQVGASGDDRHQHQREAYFAWPLDELFVVEDASRGPEERDLPGPPRRRTVCAACGEEVSDGREVLLAGERLCQPCASLHIPATV
jgi:formylmethanofuran dehydrogenase subunit E